MELSGRKLSCMLEILSLIPSDKDISWEEALKGGRLKYFVGVSREERTVVCEITGKEKRNTNF
jgi:hypothetical protein